VVVILTVYWVRLHYFELAFWFLDLGEHLVVRLGQTLEQSNKVLIDGFLLGKDVIHLFDSQVDIVDELALVQFEDLGVDVGDVDVASHLQHDFVFDHPIWHFVVLKVVLDGVVQLEPKAGVEFVQYALVLISLHQRVIQHDGQRG